MLCMYVYVMEKLHETYILHATEKKPCFYRSYVDPKYFIESRIPVMVFRHR